MTTSSHQKRLLTSLIAAPIIVGAIVFEGIFLFLTILLISSLGLWEFYSMFWKESHKQLKMIGVFFGGLLLLAAYLKNPLSELVILILLFWVANILFLIGYSREKLRSYDRVMVLLVGIFYLPLLLQFVFPFSSMEILFVLLATFASDTGAFYAGNWWGTHRIWPRISPKKTWEGSLGGLFLCICVSLFMGLIFGQASWYVWLFVGLVLNLGAQMGDFFESGLKRSLEIKDSGRVLPGHGGILDRTDSLLLVLPLFALLRSLITLF